MKRRLILLCALILSFSYIAAVNVSYIEYKVLNPPANQWIQGQYGVRLPDGETATNKLSFRHAWLEKSLELNFINISSIPFNPNPSGWAGIYINFKNGQELYSLADIYTEKESSNTYLNKVTIKFEESYLGSEKKASLLDVLKLLANQDIDSWFVSLNLNSANPSVDNNLSKALTNVLPTQNSKGVFRKLLSEMQTLAGNSLKEVSPIISQALGTSYKPSTSTATQQQTQRSTTPSTQQKTNDTSTRQTTQNTTSLKYLSDVKISLNTIDNNKYWEVNIMPKEGMYSTCVIKMVSDSGRQLTYSGPKVHVKMLNWEKGNNLSVKLSAFGKNDSSHNYTFLPAEKKYITPSSNTAKIVVEVYEYATNKLLETYESPLYKLEN